jgi:FAD/FMN-containing dehydrogenase
MTATAGRGGTAGAAGTAGRGGTAGAAGTAGRGGTAGTAGIAGRGGTGAAPLEEALAEVVGAANVLTDPDLLASYETDWTGRFSGRARCVVRPADTAAVSAVLAACSSAGVPVTVQGGNTGLVGGGVPAGGEVLLSTRRLAGLGPVDTVAGQVTAGAGVPLAVAQEHARRSGFDLGIDFAARDSATVGGLVATNAGGEQVLRHGGMRAQVVGLEAVLADGSVLSRLAGLPKDNTGYDLVGLLAGSEGTLAVITRVRLRLVPLLTARTVALVAVDGVGTAMAALRELAVRLPMLNAAELFGADGLALVRAHTGLPAPLPAEYPAYLLVECADRSDPTDALVDALAEVSELVDGIADAAIATDSAGRAKLWRYREAHTESISAVGVPVKLDVSVPLAQLADTVAALPATVEAAAPGARLIVFGHLNEGNLHVNVLDAGEHGHAVTDAVLRLVTGCGGSISAEHGVGRAKTQWLPLSRSPVELAAMQAVKTALDPGGILNPGVLLPAR